MWSQNILWCGGALAAFRKMALGGGSDDRLPDIGLQHFQR